jgi:signal transduction histidine kinase
LYAIAPFAAARRTTLTRIPPCNYTVAIGADRFEQIMINVLENAIKHGREGGTVAVTVAVLDERFVEVRIDDDGPGVAASEREAIFALAKRGANASSKGTGIGLVVVRLMVERIGGEVDVVESPLGGAQFRVRLPR